MEDLGQLLEVEEDLPPVEAHGDIEAVEDALVVHPVGADGDIAAVGRGRCGSYFTATRARTVFMQNAAKRREAKLMEKKTEAEAALSIAKAAVPGVAQLFGKHGTTVGRLRTLSHIHMLPLVRSVHLPAKQNPNFGIKHRRLQTAVADAILSRQSEGMHRMIANTAASRNTEHDRKRKFVHVHHTHLWDGVSTKYRRLSAGTRYRLPQTVVRHEVLVQRGISIISTMDMEDESQVSPVDYQEPWLVQPCIVDSTGAAATEPAVMSGLPEELQFVNPANVDRLRDVGDSFTSTTLDLLADKAAGNLLLMKFFVYVFMHLIMPFVKNFFLSVDTCNAHLHHRAKTTLPTLKQHTLRLFSAAHLSKFQRIQSRSVAFTERRSAELLDRVLRPPPDPEELGSSLYIALDLLLDFEADHHKRDGDATNQFMEDMRQVGEFCNGELHNNRIKHYCWQPNRQPCCRNRAECEEKCQVLFVNALHSRSSKIPTESTWTHTLASMQEQIIRRLLWNLGLDAFCEKATVLPDGEEDVILDGGEQVSAASFTKMNASRESKTVKYHRDDWLQNTLVVLCMLVMMFDKFLLYPFLGDATTDRSQLEELLDPSTSKVGQCSQAFLDMLREWRNENKRRRPWGLLDALRVPLREQRYMRFVRGNVLRLSTASFRRYELKFSDLLYKMWLVVMGYLEEGEQVAVCERVLQTPQEEIDVYLRGFRNLYSSVELLLSKEARETYKTDMKHHWVSTDVIERLNSSILRSHPPGAPARSFIYAARESVICQANALHKTRGGAAPLDHQMKIVPGQQERVTVNPMLVEPQIMDAGDAQDGAGELGPSAPLPQPAPAPAPLPQPAPDVGEIPSANSNPDIRIGSAGVESNWKGATFVRQPSLSSHIEAIRPQETYRTDTIKVDNAPQDLRKKVGLSPKLLEFNSFLKTLKEAKGSKLNDEEIVRAREDFEEQWNALHDHSVYEALYEEWRSTPTVAAETVNKKPYKTMWGGGTSSTAVSAKELFAEWSRCGWPKDRRIHDADGEQAVQKPNADIDFSECKSVTIFGVGRWARNIPRRLVESPEQMNIIELGMHYYFQSLPRADVDCGEILMLLSGVAMDGDSARQRYIISISGVVWNPTVFDVTYCDFSRQEDCNSVELAFPFEVMFRSRPNRVSSKFLSLDHATSDELILRMVETMITVEAHKLLYDIVDDGTLLKSEVHGCEFVGKVWEPGMTAPFMDKPRGKKPAKSGNDGFLSGDPLNGKTAPRRQRSARGGRGR